jgi:dynein assembly factor 3
MSLDPHHCFNFWGASPALDLKAAVSAARASASPEASTSDETPSAKTTTGDDDGERDPLTTLLLGTSDPRHVFTTLARSRRGADKDKALVFYVHEAHVVELARQVLLVSVLASDDLPPTDRTERI